MIIKGSQQNQSPSMRVTSPTAPSKMMGHVKRSLGSPETISIPCSAENAMEGPAKSQMGHVKSCPVPENTGGSVSGGVPFKG